MQKLSKKERHEAYKIALSNLIVYQYICLALRVETMFFDEFLLFAPDGWTDNKSFGSYIYHKSTKYHSRTKAGIAFRQTILMFCIEMTKPNGKKR